MSNELTAALHQLLNAASPDLKRALTRDLNQHLDTARTIGGRTIMRDDDFHNILLRWSITAQVALTPTRREEPKTDEHKGNGVDHETENRLIAMNRALNDELSVRGERTHPALS
jgi:hypothetical protein